MSQEEIDEKFKEVAEMKEVLDNEAAQLGENIRKECNDYIRTQTQSPSGQIYHGGRLKVCFGTDSTSSSTETVISMIQDSETHTIEKVFFASKEIHARHVMNDKLRELGR